ncbi:MAG: YqeG family HAD IIIA-type phosphatase [Oscillospiraceae bacterium]|nr:YqeG family HAD IIIA-type phosphatase [Oscillospiraceae bacterium]
MLKPTYELNHIFDITPRFLAEIGVKGLILDIDNTMTTHDNPTAAEGVSEWLTLMNSHKIKMIILSNNTPERVRPFARVLKLRFVSKGRKPLSSGFKRAIAKLKLPKSQICAVGDQIFTDILGANLAGVKSILVHPFEAEKTLFFKFKRFMEKPFRGVK